MEIELKTELLINEFEQEINTFATQTKKTLSITQTYLLKASIQICNKIYN